jgi:hypothetical protein
MRGMEEEGAPRTLALTDFRRGVLRVALGLAVVARVFDPDREDGGGADDPSGTEEFWLLGAGLWAFVPRPGE